MIVVLGDSHTQAIGRCLDRLDVDLKTAITEKFGKPVVQMILPGYQFFSNFHWTKGTSVYFEYGGRKKVGEILENDGAMRPEDGHVFGFSFGFHSAVMLREDYWKDYTILKDVKGKAYISEAVFRQIVLDENKHVLRFARAMKDSGTPFFFICAPPIRQALLDRQADIASAVELIAIKETYRRLMMSAFDELGVRYVLPPEKAMENSILKPEFDSGIPEDVHHANQWYGMLMWQEFLDKIAI